MLEELLSGDISAAVWVLIGSVLAIVLGAAVQTFFSSKSLRFIAMCVVALLAILGALALAAATNGDQLAKLAGRLQHATNAGRGDPVVVGVFPSDAYGPSQRDGLHVGLAPYSRLIRVVDISAPYADLKANNAPQVLTQLREALTHLNVVAIVGPGVTEFSRAMVRAVELSGQDAPVFVTGSAPRETIGWLDSELPLFRVNSGIDEHADDFVRLAYAAAARDVPMVFLVETSVNSDQRTYGQVLFDHIVRKVPQWSQWVEAGIVTNRAYHRGALVEEMSRWDAGSFLDRRQLVMLLGAGRDYLALVEAHYGAAAPARRSIIGGWMNAYSTEPAYRRAAFQWSRMFELTDVSLAPADNPANARFLAEFGPFTPALRDQAFLFDVGNLVGNSLQQAIGQGNIADLHTDAGFYARYAAIIRGNESNGVTGPIRFNAMGQNVGPADDGAGGLNYVQFQNSQQGWRQLDGPESIVGLIDASSAAQP